MEQQIQSVDLAHSMQITVQSQLHMYVKLFNYDELDTLGLKKTKFRTSSVTFQFHLQGLSKGK